MRTWFLRHAKSIHRAPRPTWPEKAKRLGYKAKQGEWNDPGTSAWYKPMNYIFTCKFHTLAKSKVYIATALPISLSLTSTSALLNHQKFYGVPYIFLKNSWNVQTIDFISLTNLLGRFSYLWKKYEVHHPFFNCKRLLIM